MVVIDCFRPLDGESISKRASQLVVLSQLLLRFRPLDGESISKPDGSSDSHDTILFPSPRRGINF